MISNVSGSDLRSDCLDAKQSFLTYAAVVLLTGALLQLSGLLQRAELQTIDRLFELRYWFDWKPEGLRRISIPALIEYHENHEIPRRWWAWDFTLSWLIEPNRVDTKEKIVIFNRLLEDEPPITELEQSPWMRPLMQYPLSRSTLADCVEFLACSGARLIILDNDFPQYSSDDDRLARAIHDCTHGKFGGRKVPVLIAGTVVHRATGRSVQLNFPPPAPGVLKALSKLEPETDLTERYVGNVSMVMDEDQIVRRCVCARPAYSQLHLPSIAVKSLAALGEQIPPNLPAIIDIDFSGPPDSEDFPVRPMSYLLDPVLRQKVRSEHCDDVPGGKNSSPQSGDTVHRDAMGCDVTIDGSIVILGDGVVDRFATPYTNSGVSLRSGSEIIAQSIDTIARRSWPRRMSATESVLYFSAVALLGAAVWCWRRSIAPWGRRPMRPNQRLAIPWLFIDLAFYAVTVGLSFFSACLLFSHARLIVPLVIPIVSVTIGALATALRERELETSYWLKVQLKQAAEKLQLENEKHVIELRAQAAESQTRQIEQAESIRKDFVRKINHDLKAPVTVMSWTLAKWKTEGLACATAERKLERMVRTCDRLVSLLHELASNYEHAADAGDAPNDVCELNEVLSNCVNRVRPRSGGNVRPCYLCA